MLTILFSLVYSVNLWIQFLTLISIWILFALLNDFRYFMCVPKASGAELLLFLNQHREHIEKLW